MRSSHFHSRSTNQALAGSYAIEELTNEIEQRVRDYLDKIDALGGTLQAIETGYIQREIQNSAYEYQRAIEKDEAIVVGVNRFESDEESKMKTLRVDPAIEQTQIKRLGSLRDRRDYDVVEGALTNLETAARGTENLLPRILACVESFATVGETNFVTVGMRSREGLSSLLHSSMARLVASYACSMPGAFATL